MDFPPQRDDWTLANRMAGAKRCNSFADLRFNKLISTKEMTDNYRINNEENTYNAICDLLNLSDFRTGD